jgi:hypothetical protein
VSHALCGTTGTLGADALLEALRTLRCSGTLVLGDGSGSMILQLAKGQVEASFKLGAYARLDAVGQTFHLNPHEPSELPELPARRLNGGSPLLRALPRLRPPATLPLGATDLATLLERLHAESFDGVLSYESHDEIAVALFTDGAIRAAVHERAGRLSSRTEALRILQKRSSETGTGTLELERLDRPVAEALLALALDRVVPDGADPAFTGVEVDDTGFRFFRQGQPYLSVPGVPHGAARRYALTGTQAATTAPLSLPTEPPGWEEQRYALTLRGRDALNPMTELNMEFRSHHGELGQRVLDALGKGDTLQQTADGLGLELVDLKPWLGKLEGSGMIRMHRG